MSFKTSEEYEAERNKKVASMRSYLDYSMGVLISLIGLFLVFRYKFDIGLNKKFPPDIWDKVYGIVALVYGIWRIYRGYKKNYFK